jgi:hypothetical protein
MEIERIGRFIAELWQAKGMTRDLAPSVKKHLPWKRIK